jgi:hypothetical protein
MDVRLLAEGEDVNGEFGGEKAEKISVTDEE